MTLLWLEVSGPPGETLSSGLRASQVLATGILSGISCAVVLDEGEGAREVFNDSWIAC